jgi:hypothetical protein
MSAVSLQVPLELLSCADYNTLFYTEIWIKVPDSTCHMPEEILNAMATYDRQSQCAGEEICSKLRLQMTGHVYCLISTTNSINYMYYIRVCSIHQYSHNFTCFLSFLLLCSLRFFLNCFFFAVLSVPCLDLIFRLFPSIFLNFIPSSSFHSSILFFFPWLSVFL